MPSHRPSTGSNQNRSRTSGTATTPTAGAILNRVQVTPTFVREIAQGVRQNKLTPGQRDCAARILDTVAGERMR
jgi:hypothetical protein